MKFIINLAAAIALALVGHMILPWWGGVIGIGIAALLFDRRVIEAFVIGFLGLFLLWGVYAFKLNNGNESILSERMGELLGGQSALVVLLISALIGGILGGFAGMTGNLGRKLFASE